MSMKFSIDLGDRLLLRWANEDDIDELAQFNIKIHSSDSRSPQLWLGNWTRDLMTGTHPTTKASDFTVVVDQNKGSKIVSSLNLISQTWTYDGIPFPVGRIELVGTDPDYRRRGLVRRQMEVIHDLSSKKDELIQAITGIPWYYRQFGYEMALNLSGGRNYYWNHYEGNKTPQDQKYSLRPAVEDDIPLLDHLYSIHCAQSMITCARETTDWKYGITTADKESPGAFRCQIVEDSDGKVAAYAEIRQLGTGYIVREFGVHERESWYEIGHFLVQKLKSEAEILNKDRDEPITNVYFNLGEDHPIYQALEKKLGSPSKPYAWYIRVPNLALFLEHISTVFEKRLASSVMAKYSGNLNLNFYKYALGLKFEQGKFLGASPYKAETWEDADAAFPDLTFYQLLFGYRSFDELDYAFADCIAVKDDTAVLLNCLFPRRPSDVSGLN